MEIFYQNKNYLNIIINYLNIKDILSLSMCCKTLKENLDPNNNPFVNILFYLTMQKEFFDFDNSLYFKDKKNLSGNFIIFKANWKYFLNQLYINFNACKDEKARKRIKDFFLIHIFLPALRKECQVLEYPNSTVIQTRNYDISINQMHAYNFYSKYITPEYILDPNNNDWKISILKEKMIYEDSLINFKQLFNDFIKNKQYKDFINNVVNYAHKYIDELFPNLLTNNNIFNTNEQNNKIIRFIIFACNSIKLYSQINYEYINDLSTIENEHQILTEYIKKKNEIISVALLIDTQFDNVNIIINLLSIYKNIYDDYKEKNSRMKRFSIGSLHLFNLNEKDAQEYKNKIIYSPKFSLFKLFEKIIHFYYVDKLSHIRSKFQIVVKNYFKEAFYPPENEQPIKKNEININLDLNKEEEKSENIIEEIKNDDKENSNENENVLKKIKDIKATEKFLVQNFINSELDDVINEKNIYGIMHTKLIIDEKYINNCENVLINLFEEQIKKSIKENMPLDKCYEIIDEITRCEGNSKVVNKKNKESLSVIRRTQIKLMQKGHLTLFNFLIKAIEKDFEAHIKLNKENQKYIYLSEYEKYKSQEINIDSSPKKDEENIKKHVNEEYQKLFEHLIKVFKIPESETYLVNDYINCTKIDYSFLINKFFWNYYRQLEIYEERNLRIEAYIKNKKKKYVQGNECYENKAESKIELWN